MGSGVDEATAAFAQGFSCAQAVLSALGPNLGLERDSALRLAGAFGGGMAYLGQTCGAVSGALMVIGLEHGQVLPDDKPAKERTYQAAQRFAGEFMSRFGSLTCCGLLGLDISTAAGLAAAREQGLFTRVCPRFVAGAVEILEDMGRGAA